MLTFYSNAQCSVNVTWNTFQHISTTAILKLWKCWIKHANYHLKSRSMYTYSYMVITLIFERCTVRPGFPLQVIKKLYVHKRFYIWGILIAMSTSQTVVYHCCCLTYLHLSMVFFKCHKMLQYEPPSKLVKMCAWNINVFPLHNQRKKYCWNQFLFKNFQVDFFPFCILPPCYKILEEWGGRISMIYEISNYAACKMFVHS